MSSHTHPSPDPSLMATHQPVRLPQMTPLLCHPSMLKNTHQLSHINLKGLQLKFPNTPIKYLKHSLRTFSSCASLICTPAIQHLGTNPRGPKASALLQAWCHSHPIILYIDTCTCYHWYLFLFFLKLINRMFSTFAIKGVLLHIKAATRLTFKSSQPSGPNCHWKNKSNT